MICIRHPTTKLFDIILKIHPDKKAFPFLKLPLKIERIIKADPPRKVNLEIA
jgi:hypothetical protein